MEHDRTGLTDSEREMFDALAGSIGDVKVPRAVSAVGVLRRRRVAVFASAGVVLLVLMPLLLAVHVLVAFAGFVAAVVAVHVAWSGCVELFRSPGSPVASWTVWRLFD